MVIKDQISKVIEIKSAYCNEKPSFYKLILLNSLESIR